MLTARGKQYDKPAGYNSDKLINQEVGIKTECLDHRLLFNVSGYVMNWSNVQLSLFDPVYLGNTTFNINGPEYKIKGFEMQFIARLTEGLTWQGSSSVNSPSRSTALSASGPASDTGNPTPLGQCVTVKGAAIHEPVRRERYAAAILTAVDVQHPGFATSGSRATTSRSPGWVRATWAPMSNEPASYPGDDPT